MNERTNERTSECTVLPCVRVGYRLGPAHRCRLRAARGADVTGSQRARTACDPATQTPTQREGLEEAPIPASICEYM